MDLAEIIWSISRQEEINQLDEKVESGLESAFRKIRDLNSQVHALAKTCEILCTVISEKLALSPTELQEMIVRRLQDSLRISEICQSCGHRFHASRSSCLYCGFKPQEDSQ